jgi:hypothetical protein
VNIFSKQKVKKLYFTEEAAPRAAPYVNAIVRSMLHTRENPQEDVKIKLMLSVPRSVRNALHICKMDDGFSSLEHYCISILLTHLAGKGIPLTESMLSATRTNPR